MNTTGTQSFNITLTNAQLRRDAQVAISQFNKIGQSAEAQGRRIDSSINGMSKSVSGEIRKMTDGISSAMADMAKNVVGITALLSSGTFLKSLYDESKAFTREMKIVSTISEEVTADLDGFKKQVLDLCTQISVAPDTAAQALYQINSAGHLGANGMKVLEASAKAAIGGVTETATAADAITTILNAYKFSADDAEEISDKLFTTVRLGKTTMGELGRSIAYVAPLAATYKISIDEVLAAVAQLTKQGNSTQNAMTQISASITAVANELGDDAFKSGLLPALEEIEKRSNGSNLALKAQLSNIRAVRGALGLTKENAAETANMLNQLKNSAGAAETAFNKMNTGATAEMRMLRTNFLSELQSFGDGMTGTLAGLARTLNEAFESGNMQRMLEVMKDLVVAYGVYKALLITMTALRKAYNVEMRKTTLLKSVAAGQQVAINRAQATGVIITTNLRRATLSLNAALKANAFGLVVAAVTAAAYAIYKYVTHVSDAEQAQRKLNKAMSDCEAATAAETAKVDMLFAAMKNAAKGTAAYERAKKTIIDQYGEYMKGLVNERNEVVNIAAAYERVTTAVQEAARARAMEDFTQDATKTYQQKSSEALNNIAQKIRSNVKNRDEANTLTQLVMDEMRDGGAISQSTMDLLNAKFGNTRAKNGKWMYNDDINDIKSNSRNYRDAGRILSQQMQDGEAFFGTSVNEFAEYTTAQLKDALNNLNEDLSDMTAESFTIFGEGLMIATANTRAEALLARRKIEKAIADGGVSSEESATVDTPNWTPQGDDEKGKTPEQRAAEAVAARHKRMELEAQQQKERKRNEIDMQYELDQAVIDAMEDGVKKRLAQQELDYAKEKETRQREMEDAILAEIAYQKAIFDAQEEVNEKEAAKNGNTKYARKTFDTGSMLSLRNSDGSNAYVPGVAVSAEATGNVNTSAINEIVTRYGRIFADMETKNNKAWREASEAAMNEYLAQWGQGLEKRNAIIAIANKKMQEATAEGERLSIAAQLEKDLSDFDIEANKKTAAISRLFEDMSNKTIADMRKIYEEGQKALSFLTSGEWNAETGLELGISEETFNTLKKSPEELDRIRKALRELRGELDGMQSGFSTLADGLKEVFAAGGDTKAFDKAMSKISQGMQTVSQVAGFLQDSLSQLGDALGNDALGGIADGIGVAMDTLNGAMSGAQAGAAFGPWGAAAGAAIGLVSSLGSALAKLHDAKHEKNIIAIQERIDTLKDSYDDLGKNIEKAYSSDAKNLIEQQNTLLKQQRQLIQNQIAEEKVKKNADEDRIKDWEKQIEQIDATIADNKEKAIDAIFGEDVKASIDRFADAYAGMFEGGNNRAKASKDLVKEMIKNMITEAMKADMSKPMENIREKLASFWERDGKITQAAESELDAMVEAEMSAIQNKYGWADKYFKDTTQQSATAGGYETLSEDTGKSLDGRFAAFQLSNELIKEATESINEQLRDVVVKNAAMASTVEEIRDLSLIAVDHLETISKHTANLKEMNDRLEKIEKNTR